MPSSGPRGAPFPRHGPARTRPDPAGTGPPLRAPWRSRTSIHGFGDRRAAAVPMARSLFPLFGFQVSSPTVRAVACDGMRPRTAGRRNAFRRPSGSGRLRSAGPPDRFGPFRRTGLRNRPESRRLMTRCHPGFYRSSLIRLFATRRMVVAGGLEPPVFPCRRVTVCCRRRWATPPVHRFCPSRRDAYRARFICARKLMGDGSGSWSCRESNPGLACRQPLLAVTCVSDA